MYFFFTNCSQLFSLPMSGRCPVCSKNIPLKAINKHLDDVCLNAEGQDRRRSERYATLFHFIPN